MSGLNRGQLRQEALTIARWAEIGQAPSREVLAKLELLGPDGHEFDYGGQETGVGNTCGGDDGGLPDLGPLSDFGSWESVAATILRRTEEAAGFDPSSTVFDPVAWIRFVCQFQEMPFLTRTVGPDSSSAYISSLSLLGAIWVVRDLVEWLVTPDTLTGIINSVKKIGQLAVENEGRQEKDSNVQQGVLTVVDGDLRLGLLRTTVQMQYETGKGYQHLYQQITVSSLFGSLDYGMCKRQAELLLEWDGQDVDAWVEGASSSRYPPNTSPAWNN